MIGLAALGLLASAPAAQDFGLDGVDVSAISGRSGEAPAPVPERAAAARYHSGKPAAASVQAPAGMKEWTVMAFESFKNNLEWVGLGNMNELERIGSTDRVNIVAEAGRMGGYNSSDGDWRGVRRYYVTRDNDASHITSPVLQELGDANMGDASELLGFISWAKARYPARRYLLIIGSHGSGWLKGNPKTHRGKGISFDYETGNNLDIPQLGLVMAKAGGVDMLVMDACLMQMAEVLYEVKGAASFMVGSEEVTWGYPYHKMLKPLVLSPEMGAERLGRAMVDVYWKANLVSTRSATHSLLDVSRAGGLAERMDRFAGAAIASGEKELLKKCRSGAAHYGEKDNKDLRSFAKLAAERAASVELRAAAGELVSYISGSVVLSNRVGVLPPSDSGGLAVYLPQYYDSAYGELKLARDTRWKDFLVWLCK